MIANFVNRSYCNDQASNKIFKNLHEYEKHRKIIYGYEMSNETLRSSDYVMTNDRTMNRKGNRKKSCGLI